MFARAFAIIVTCAEPAAQAGRAGFRYRPEAAHRRERWDRNYASPPLGRMYLSKFPM